MYVHLNHVINDKHLQFYTYIIYIYVNHTMLYMTIYIYNCTFFVVFQDGSGTLDVDEHLGICRWGQIIGIVHGMYNQQLCDTMQHLP